MCNFLGPYEIIVLPAIVTATLTPTATTRFGCAENQRVTLRAAPILLNGARDASDHHGICN